MIEDSGIDYGSNPIYRLHFEAGRAAERRRSASDLLGIAYPDRPRENDLLVDVVPDEEIEGLIKAVSDILRGRAPIAHAEPDRGT